MSKTLGKPLEVRLRSEWPVDKSRPSTAERKDLLMSIRKKERIRPARLTLLALVDVDARSGIVRGTYRYTALRTLAE